MGSRADLDPNNLFTDKPVVPMHLNRRCRDLLATRLKICGENASRMKRTRICRSNLWVATMLMVAMLSGCAALKDSSDDIVRINVSQNPAKAMRLTHAGIKALNIGAIDDAAQKFNAAIAADETYGPAHNNLGLMHYEQGNLYQAVLAFEAAMDYLPHDPTVYFNLALALESAGRTFEAMDLYQQAVEMAPTNPHFLGNLVRLRVRMEERDESVKAQLQDLALIETRPQWRPFGRTSSWGCFTTTHSIVGRRRQTSIAKATKRTEDPENQPNA